MKLPIGQRRSWYWAAGLLLVAVLTQACGGGGRSTGASGPTNVTVVLKGTKTAQISANCTTRTLTASRPGSAPRSVTIAQDGHATIFVTPGVEWTFTVVLVCNEADGPLKLTAEQTQFVGGGPLTLTFSLARNRAPRVSASCASPVAVNAPSSCGCSASDPDGDPLSFSWSASGGNLSAVQGDSTQFSSPSAGTFDVTCAVTDGRGGLGSATAPVAVGGAGPYTPPPYSRRSSLFDPVRPLYTVLSLALVAGLVASQLWRRARR